MFHYRSRILLKLKTESRDGLIIIYLFGGLVGANFYDIEDDINREIEKKPGTIALNLEGLEDLDSTGIGYLVKVRTKALGNDVGLVLYNISITILELITIAGMDHLFTIMSYDDFAGKYLNEK